MGGPGSGRYPHGPAVIERAKAGSYTVTAIDGALPALLDGLIARATAAPCPKCGAPVPARGADNVAMYLIDRLLGRPRIEIEAHTTHELHLTADDYAVIAQAAALEARLLRGRQALPPANPVDTAIEAEVREVSGDDDSPPAPHPEVPADTRGAEGD